jgi:hypothetical protein
MCTSVVLAALAAMQALVVLQTQHMLEHLGCTHGRRLLRCWAAASSGSDDDGVMGELGGRKIMDAAKIDASEYYVKNIDRGTALDPRHQGLLNMQQPSI